jgi:hypothetical protein
MAYLKHETLDRSAALHMRGSFMETYCGSIYEISMLNIC